jgi:hypothetical protein
MLYLCLCCEIWAYDMKPSRAPGIVKGEVIVVPLPIELFLFLVFFYGNFPFWIIKYYVHEVTEFNKIPLRVVTTTKRQMYLHHVQR